MVQVRVASLAIDSRSQPVLILKPVSDEPGEGRLLPIWIGVPEATAILLAIEGGTTPRPLVYDLMKSLLDSLGAQVERVEITRIEEGTFHAAITVRTGDRTEVIDARPSDSVALATRMEAPIYVADEVLAEAGVPDESESTSDQDSELAAFSEFLDSVDPADFQG